MVKKLGENEEVVSSLNNMNNFPGLCGELQTFVEIGILRSIIARCTNVRDLRFHVWLLLKKGSTL